MQINQETMANEVWEHIPMKDPKTEPWKEIAVDICGSIIK